MLSKLFMVFFSARCFFLIEKVHCLFIPSMHTPTHTNIHSDKVPDILYLAMKGSPCYDGAYNLVEEYGGQNNDPPTMSTS